MCFHSKQTKKAKAVEKRFNAKVLDLSHFKTSDKINGFTYPSTSVVLDDTPSLVQQLNWGLIPAWAKDNSIRQYTLNAKIETLHQKPSFKNSINKRCLVIANGFYEWQWLDKKGRNKKEYLLGLENEALFAFAGIWSEWQNEHSGETQKTYSIVTTEAQGIMREIHNSKLRMPIVLSPEAESDWLAGEEVTAFVDPLVDLKAISLSPQQDLFGELF